MSCVTLVKAALSRVLFGAHALVTVWRVVSQEGDTYWKLGIGIIILFCDGLHALCNRKGEELKHFCPSVFIFLGTILPAVWILELHTDRRELLCLTIENFSGNQYQTVNENTDWIAKNMKLHPEWNGARVSERMRNKMKHSLNKGEKYKGELKKDENLLLNLMQIKMSDIELAKQTCKNVTISPFTRRRMMQHEDFGLKKIEGLDIDLSWFKLKPEQWIRILEQTVLVVLVLGRWLLPKGKLTRDQFSQLMLVYLGMAADIAEIPESFREFKVILEPNLTIAILFVWSWSLLQFCLVLGGSHRGRKSRLAQTSDECEDANQRVFNRQSSTKSSIKSHGSSNNERKKQIKMDIMVIATNTLLQDLPFFCLRMVLIFRFHVISHMNIFFTCKNTLVLLLQTYRLLILLLENRPRYRRQSRLMSLVAGVNIQDAAKELHYHSDTPPSTSSNYNIPGQRNIQNSELEESASEYLSAGCHDEHNCALKTNTDIDDYDDDKHSTTSTKLEDEEGSVRVQLPPVRRSQQAFFRRNGNNSTDHQLFSRRKSSKEKYSHKSVSRRRNNYRQYTTSTTASSELPLSTSPDDSAVEETIYTGASGPNITETIDAMIHEHICHPKIVHKPSLASTSHTLKANAKNGDDNSKHSNKRADKKQHRSSIKRFQTSVKKSRPQTLV